MSAIKFIKSSVSGKLIRPQGYGFPAGLSAANTSLTVTSNTSVDYLVVGGGASGGSAGGGGSGYVGGHPSFATSNTTTTQGSGTSVANSGSPLYTPGVGNGGASGANVGQAGRVVIILSET